MHEAGSWITESKGALRSVKPLRPYCQRMPSRHLRPAISGSMEHYQHEMNHQSLGNALVEGMSKTWLRAIASFVANGSAGYSVSIIGRLSPRIRWGGGA
jgi:NAD-dependent DNA ligase